MKTFYFERTTVDFFHLEAESLEEAVMRLRNHSDRHMENRTEVAWIQTDKDGYWMNDISMEDPT